MRITTVEQAAAWVEEVGLALLFPNGDYVLPSLWEAAAGHAVVDWSVRDDDGKFVSFTPEMELVWSRKDELPARKLACVGTARSPRPCSSSAGRRRAASCASSSAPTSGRPTRP